MAHIAPATNASHNEEQLRQQQVQVERVEQWVSLALLESVEHAPDTPRILDCDATIKTLYGHQSGAEVSYNPH